MIFYKRIGKTKFSVERLPARNSFGVSDAGHDSGSIAYQYLHVVILKDLVFRIAFLRFRQIISPRSIFPLELVRV